jgi:hypothetical protein
VLMHGGHGDDLALLESHLLAYRPWRGATRRSMGSGMR